MKMPPIIDAAFFAPCGMNYNQRYGASLVQSSLFVKEHGLAAFMEQQLETYTCPNCGGVISLHDAECSECQTKAK